MHGMSRRKVVEDEINDGRIGSIFYHRDIEIT
jgi:hypothetical protein